MKSACWLVTLCFGGLIWLVVAAQVGAAWGRATPHSAVAWRIHDVMEDWRWEQQLRYPRWHQGREP